MSVPELTTLAVPSSPLIPAGYFRSKLFSTHSTNNPLIAAASPILSLVERICVTPTLPDIAHIRSNIEHELLAFQSRLAYQKYAENTVTIAYYFLCATIDELLGKNHLRLYGQQAKFQAFTPVSQDGIGPEHHFFVIISHLKEHTGQYLDLLELAYYCLIAGFEGEYHVKADGRQALDNLIEELHQLILQHRAHKTRSLFKTQHESIIENRYYKPIILASVAAIFALLLTYVGSNSLLERQAKTLTAHSFSEQH